MANAYFTHNSVINDCRSWRFDDPLATAGELSKTKGTFQGARTLNLAVRRDLDQARCAKGIPARRLLNAASKRSNSGLAIRTIVVVEQQKPFTAAQLAADIDVWEQGKTFAHLSGSSTTTSPFPMTSPA